MTTHRDHHDIPELQPRGHLTRFSIKRDAMRREHFEPIAGYGQAPYRLPTRAPDPIDWGNVAAWVIVVLMAIAGGMLIDGPDGGIPEAKCARTVTA